MAPVLFTLKFPLPMYHGRIVSVFHNHPMSRHVYDTQVSTVPVGRPTSILCVVVGGTNSIFTSKKEEQLSNCLYYKVGWKEN